MRVNTHVIPVAAILAVAIIAFLGIAIWESQPSLKETRTAIPEPQVVTAPDADQATIPATADPSYPAPAKKLHKLLTEADQADAAELSLEQRRAQLDQQIAELNQQLQELGIDPPPQQPAQPQTQEAADTAARIQAIREHIETRDNSN